MKDGLSGGQKKEWAQLLFTRFDLSIKDIALKTGVSEEELRLWIQDGNWEGIRRSLLTSKEVQLNILYDILETITTRIKENGADNTKDADLVIKYTSAIKNLETESSVTQIIEVAKKFINRLQMADLELAKTVALHFDAYIKEELKKV
jgi:ribosome-binding factor A